MPQGGIPIAGTKRIRPTLTDPPQGVPKSIRIIECAQSPQSTRAKPAIVQRMAGQTSQRGDPVTSHFGFNSTSPETHLADRLDVTGGCGNAHRELGRNRSGSGNRKKGSTIQGKLILTSDIVTCPFGDLTKLC